MTKDFIPVKCIQAHLLLAKQSFTKPRLRYISGIVRLSLLLLSWNKSTDQTVKMRHKTDISTHSMKKNITGLHHLRLFNLNTH